MKVLLTGNNGQLGRELTLQCAQQNIEVIGFDVDKLDITNPMNIKEVLISESPQVVINCAAMTNVDGCETNKEAAMKVNGLGPQNLAKICQELDIVLVHLSTDYVFDGKGIKTETGIRPYIESDPIAPKTMYGESKALGEKYVMDTMDKYFIIRTAWLYGDGGNFVRTMLSLAESHTQLTVVNDQIGTPTSTVDLAKVILELIKTNKYGVYHATCQGICSWYDFTVEIFKQKGIEIEVKPVTSEEYLRPAPRPKYSVLENRALKKIGLDSFRTWQVSLAEYLKIESERKK